MARRSTPRGRTAASSSGTLWAPPARPAVRHPGRCGGTRCAEREPARRHAGVRLEARWPCARRRRSPRHRPLEDAATLRPLGTPFRPLSGARVYGLGFAPRTGLLVVAGAGGDLEEYDIGARHVIRRLPGHSAAVWPPAFSRDGRLMATGSFDNRVRLWDLPTGKQVGEPIPISTGIGDVSLSPDGKQLAVTTWPGVEIFDVATRRHLRDLTRADTVYDFARFTPDGRRIVGASIKGWTRLWSSETGRPVSRVLGGHAGSVTSASLSPDGRTLASGSTDGTVRLFDLASQKLLGAPLPGVPNRPVIRSSRPTARTSSGSPSRGARSAGTSAPPPGGATRAPWPAAGLPGRSGRTSYRGARTLRLAELWSLARSGTPRPRRSPQVVRRGASASFRRFGAARGSNEVAIPCPVARRVSSAKVCAVRFRAQYRPWRQPC